VSQEDIELVRSALDLLNTQDVEAVLPFIHPEFEFSTPPAISVEPQTYRGHDGLRLYFEQWTDAADRVGLVADELLDAQGDAVIASARLVARGRETGIETELAVGMVWHVHGGLAVGLEIYPTFDEAKRAAGVDG
jgi:ketosteroid isomerase-like protein